MRKLSLIALIAILATYSFTMAIDYAGKVASVKKVTIPSKSTVETNQKMLDFTFDLNGKEMKFSELTKGKIVFVNVWATWCGPCRREIPDIIEIQKEMGNDVIVVGIASERGAATDAIAKVEGFAKNQNINYINFINNSEIEKYLGSVAYGEGSGIKYVPTSFFIDRKGYIVATKQGMASKAEFISLINKAK